MSIKKKEETKNPCNQREEGLKKKQKEEVGNGKMEMLHEKLAGSSNWSPPYCLYFFQRGKCIGV